MIEVSAGIIKIDDFILVCRRNKNSYQCPLKWEFPGGKLETNETPKTALVRELREELDICITSVTPFVSYIHNYAGHPSVKLHFFIINSYKGTPVNLVFDHFSWIPRKLLGDYDFLEGDKKVIQLLNV